MLVEECSPNWSFVTSACARGGRTLRHLLSFVAGGIRAKARPWVWFEEYARGHIQLEEQHIAEVEKMMRKPGELHPAG